MPGDTTEETTVDRIGFVCVQNAGRSQMATGFAERERDRRGLDGVEIVTGGTHPADAVHESVIETMRETGIDLADRTPREVTVAELNDCDVVATMGCSTLDVGTVDDAVDIRDWDLPDPDGADPETVRAIRETVADRVAALFDEIEPA
ncbi:low molecular weight phosphatase family protein [Halobaculum sp. MBLA0143]|uniref:arsenate-mycothiol transferase ArsC n=1 Tax=Halobaculum sp. MBLA0143 TaxID=3079933 RepID=UPI003524AD72